MRYFALLAALVAAPALGQASPERLRSDVATLVGFGTRHTLSETDSDTSGIGAARRWGRAQFEQTSAACGGCLEVVEPERVFTGNRIPVGVLIRNVVAIQRGSERPDEVVIIMGHIDSRASDVMDAVSDAPGANDNASGSALVLEAARVLSKQRYPSTIVYALLSGEEQGLYGGRLLADYAKQQGWTVKAALNNDIVGGSCGSDGVCDNAHVRVFSEGLRADASEQDAARMRSLGGQDDSPSRNISRWLDGLADDFIGGLDVRQVFRADRMGRGGDHLPFLEAGFPAVRFSVAIEDYEHQHEDVRVENGVSYGDTVDEMDFPYLASVTDLNIRAADRLAQAPMPPVVSADGLVRPDVLLEWEPVAGATLYRIWRRATDQRDWQWRMDLPADLAADLNSVVLAPDRGDDWIFGVSTVASDGAESPVSSAVPGGQFAPLPVVE
ncbi:M28 family peptidase [Aurantiacibacter flavus]|uniref:M28 family peptidase n=1 Tax=Aurantiacibacter flavus TaxID=3145232 RepID=A0ABV0CWX1_9SPHN